MFKAIGGQVIDGAIEKIAQSGPKIGFALRDAIAGIKKVPGLNIPPSILKIFVDVPERWDQVPDEQKQEFFNMLIAVAIKAGTSYAKS